MTYRGHIKNGQVVLDEPAELAEGAPVTVDINLEAPKASASDDGSSLQRLLLKYAGIVTDMPSDLAQNHDHYIHGAPKK